MDSIFNDLIGGSIIIVYMDNIFIFENELPVLIENTKNVLQCLQDNDLYLKPSKWKFHKTKIEYLGLVIEEGEISTDTTKLKGIWDWPIPTTVKQVRGIMGVTSLHSCSVLARDSNKELSSIWAKGTSKGYEQSVVDWTI